ncbi:MAG: Bax inhibitor-1/YccA family protein [Deltaproteobacteria bacterium]|nr:Bax inhibitor-1/YccA family protein [Deltaproteobacteria bacterium]
MFRTANPTLKDNTFKIGAAIDQAGTMTISGTVNKTATLILITMGAALWPWQLYFGSIIEEPNVAAVYPYLIGGAIGGFIVGIITAFKKKLAYITAPIYAVLEGLFLGSISAVFESMYPGIAFQAIMLTFGVLFSLLMAYKSGLIKVTENFRLGVVAATGGIFLIYLMSFIGSLFGFNMPFIHDSGPIGIGVSVFIVIVASLNLVLDFDFIEHGAENGAPKYMEWYAAFGLLVTLVWLYIEILRLLAKLRDR